MLSLSSNIVGSAFEGYVSACFQKADTFSLTKNRWRWDESEEHARVLQRLSPYYIRTLHTNHWFAFYLPEGYELEVYLFRADPEAKRIILEEYNSLFIGGNIWKKPEDLCFFKEGRLFSGSVSHEYICYVYEQGHDWDEQIKHHGIWEQVPDELNERIQIS